MADARSRFRQLHATGLFVMPNPWDPGSARLLASAGFPALATTSSGFAASLGRRDGEVSLDELVEHTAAMVHATALPVNVDAEHCFDDVTQTIERLAAVGAAGVSIEDFDRAAGTIDPLEVALARVTEAVDAARRTGVVLTARAENHLHGIDDLDDTIARLVAFRDAGAEVVYAPGLRSLERITRLVAEADTAVNVLALPGGPSITELGTAGVRRVSTGGALARAAYGELMRAAAELTTAGTSDYAARAVPMTDLYAALGHGVELQNGD